MNSTLKNTLSGSLLVSGTMVGAGMLGIPLVTGLYGFYAASAITLVVWAFMLITGLMLLEVSLKQEQGASFLALADKYFSFPGKLATSLLFGFLYYCLLIAYCAAGAPLLVSLFAPEYSGVLSYLLFAVLFGSIVAFGPKSIDRFNILFTLAMLGFGACLLVMGLPQVQTELVNRGSFHSFWLSMPILFSAFGYHNIIPSLTTYLKKDRAALTYSIVIGTVLPLVLYLLWQLLIIGSIPEAYLQAALKEGIPATTLFSRLQENQWIVFFANYFALFAIITSTLGVSFSLVDFLADAARVQPKGNIRWVLSFLVFAPPFFCAWKIPHIFDQALEMAGGIGESLLNGFLPAAFVFASVYLFKESPILKWCSSKALLLIASILSIITLLIEVFQLLKA